MNSNKVKYIDLQMLGIIGFIIALILSYVINYDKKMVLTNNKRIFTNTEAQKLVRIQTTLLFAVTLLFLYSNYNQYKISISTNDKDAFNNYLSICIAALAVIGASIGIYIANNSNSNLTISETEI